MSKVLKQFILATFNRHKTREIHKILKVKLRCLADFYPPLKIIENGKTFEENAIKKARAAAQKYKMPALADDSGLMVDCLGGEPGVKSARYAGPHPTKEKLCRKLLREIHKAKGRELFAVCRKPSAKFVCCVAVVWPDGREKICRGEVKGYIINEVRGQNGFGYDPVFIPRGYKKTFAQMRSSFKNKISHRARALRKIKKLINGDKI